MEVHIQKCQNCGSRELRNVLVRDEQQKVYVQCRSCDDLVARYILSSGGYFHAGKEFESFLRSIERDGGTPSAYDVTALYNETEENSLREFEQLKRSMHERYGDDLP